MARAGLKFDVIVVGAGLLGTATVREILSRIPRLQLAIVEKEKTFSFHQSGHNSGVIHTGIYYTPGTIKAELCVKGCKLTYKYCEEKRIPFKKCGKLIVATDNSELPRLIDLYLRGKQNGVDDLSLVDANDIKKIEPNCQGVKAIWSPNTGIVDWAEVNRTYGKDCREKGATIYFNFCVTGLKIDYPSLKDKENYPVILCGENMDLQCKYVVTCAGLYSDKIAVMSGCSPDPKIFPFRGEYLLLKPDKCHMVRTNIYPVPNPQLPFLGVHFTPRIDGSVWLGPNAVLAFKRDGYKRSDFSFKDCWEIITYPGLQKLAKKHALFGLQQFYDGINISAQVRQLKKYVPKLSTRDVLRGPTGVRAQALNRDGTLVDDFIFDTGKGILGERVLHVRNAPSPAATSSLAIANVIADKVQKHFTLK